MTGLNIAICLAQIGNPLHSNLLNCLLGLHWEQCLSMCPYFKALALATACNGDHHRQLQHLPMAVCHTRLCSGEHTCGCGKQTGNIWGGVDQHFWKIQQWNV